MGKVNPNPKLLNYGRPEPGSNLGIILWVIAAALWAPIVAAIVIALWHWLR